MDEEEIYQNMIFAIGILAQALFASRTLVQWYGTERRRSVQNPLSYWVISLAGCIVMFLYGALRNDVVIMVGQAVSYFIYFWNIRNKNGIDVWASILAMAVPLAFFVTIGMDWDNLSYSFMSEEGIRPWLLVFGLAGQAVWSFRMIYQLIYSYRRGRSELPSGFWIIGLIGALMICTYAVLRRDIPLLIGQSASLVPIVRNLYFLYK